MTDDIKRNRRESDEKIERGEYDVFLSYNSKDRERVIEIGNWLKDNGIAPFLDKWDLQPGKSWIRAITQQISKSKAAAIFISEAGLGPFQTEEMEAFLLEYVARGCPVIPVLLPNAPEQENLSPFLKTKTWVDFRKKVPDPLEYLIWGITGKKPIKVYRPGILIASLGDSPVVISAMYDLLTEREKLTLDRVTILHPNGEDVQESYKLVRDTLSNVKELETIELDFDDADSWRNACVFLQHLWRLLRQYEEQKDSVYLSLAGGRKSMAALTAWVVPFFSCVKGLYHVISPEKEYFPSVYEIKGMSEAKRSREMHPRLDQLKLVEIPFDKGQEMSAELISKLRSSLPEDYEKAEALITGQTILQGDDIPQVEVTGLVVEQFKNLLTTNRADAHKVRNGLLEMSQIDTLRNHIGSDTHSYKVSHLGRVVLHSYTGLSVPIHPIFYTRPSDISDEADEPIERVVVCTLQTPDEHGFDTLKELAPALISIMKKTFSVDTLPPVPSPEESTLIVPLGESPMVATQLYTLLTKQQQRTIREVVLIYPQRAAAIINGAKIIRDALRDEYDVDCRLVGIPGLEDITTTEHCEAYQEYLVKEIKRVQKETEDGKIDLALSGGRKGMTAMTIFAAQKCHIPYVYHTLVTDKDTNEKIDEQTTITALNETSLSQQERYERLFLRAYEVEGPDPYANFVLFRVPVFTAEGW
jgi:CRISPR-associated Csx14 family protein